MQALRSQNHELQAALIPFEINQASTPSKIFEAIKPHLTLKDFRYSSIRFSKKAIVLKTLMGLGGLLGRVPLIPISAGFEKQIPYLGPVMAATNFTALGSFFVWASSHIVDQMTTKLAISESNTSNFNAKAKKIALLAFNIINGFVSLVPGLVVSWDYNQSRPYMVIFSALDVTSPIYSLQLLSFEILARISPKPVEKKLSKIKELLCLKLDYMIDKMIKNEPFYLIESFHIMDTYTSSEEKLKKLLDIDIAPPENPTLKGCSKAIARMLAFSLICVQLAGLGVISAEGISNLTDNKILLAASSIYVVICNMFLTSLLLKESADKAVLSLFLILKNKVQNRYISESLYPVASKVAQVFALSICLTTFVPAAQVSKDHLTNNLFWPSTIGYGLGFVLMDYGPFRDLQDDLIAFICHKTGSKEEKERLHVYQQLKEIKNILLQSDNLAFSRFLAKFSHHPMITSFMENESLTLSELQAYAFDAPIIDYEGIV